MIYANTTSHTPTRFLQGVQLIIEGREHFNVPSENWPYPTVHTLGIPVNDSYYCEIWVDGMDWQASYWALEEKNLEKPSIVPFLIFENSEDDIFNQNDFHEFIQACLTYRRDKFWIQKNELGYFADSIWPFLYFSGSDAIKHRQMKKYTFEHASQKPVTFWLNVNFIPEQYRQNKKVNKWLTKGGFSITDEEYCLT